MPVFHRRPTAPEVKGHYSLFRPFVREDFSECCAYCLLHEILAGGSENFQLDHFHPQSIFLDLVNNFFNLYYSCYPCNYIKLNAWPKAELEASGYRFIDLCQEWFSTHFQETDDGRWQPQTKAGEYTEARLRLNRKHLVETRAWLRKVALLHGGEPINWDTPSKNQIARLWEQIGSAGGK
jgi:hypothetical protein